MGQKVFPGNEINLAQRPSAHSTPSSFTLHFLVASPCPTLVSVVFFHHDSSCEKWCHLPIAHPSTIYYLQKVINSQACILMALGMITMLKVPWKWGNNIAIINNTNGSTRLCFPISIIVYDWVEKKRKLQSVIWTCHVRIDVLALNQLC